MKRKFFISVITSPMMVSFRVFLILEKIYVVLCLVVSFFEFGVFLLQFINSNGRFPETLRNFSVMLLSVVSVIACTYLSYGVNKKNASVVKGYIWYFVIKFTMYYILAMYAIYYFGRDKPDVNVNFWFISTTAVTFSHFYFTIWMLSAIIRNIEANREVTIEADSTKDTNLGKANQSTAV